MPARIARNSSTKISKKPVNLDQPSEPECDYDSASDFDEIPSDAQRYKKLEHIDHIIARKGMYLGNFRNCEQSVYTGTITPKLNIKKEKLMVSPGLLKLFDELAMNAVDQITVSGRGAGKLTEISFEIDTKKKLFGCLNDGKGIPVEIFDGTDKYIPEVLFTQPMSGSNFGESTDGAGQNGIGIKLTSILSDRVELKVIDKKREYNQVVYNSCRDIRPPTINPVKGKHKNIVSYKFMPNLKLIDEKTSPKLWEEVLINTANCMTRRVMEIRALIDPSISIRVNGTSLPAFSFDFFATRLWNSHLSSKHINTLDEYANKFCYIVKPNMKLFVALSPTFEQVSYVNKINTEEGGAHIKLLTEIINKDFRERLKTKNTFKTRLFVCMSIDVKTPEFSSQAKTKLTNAEGLSNIVKLTGKDLNNIFESLDLANIFNDKRQEKVEKMFSSRRVTKDCPKLLDAEQAGRKNAFNTLFICEGDSASSLAKIGMTCPNIGHKNFGCLPLQGKIDNVRGGKDKLSKSLKNPEEADEKLKRLVITQLLITLGATPGRNYTSANELRYQRVVVLKDADSDGANILGLVYNAIDVLFDSVLHIDGFFCEFITPMIKVHISQFLFKSLRNEILNGFGLSGTIVTHNGTVTLPFYNKPRYEEFMSRFSSRIPKNVKVEYVKGLAGHQQYEIKEYFKEYNDNVIPIEYDKDTGNLLEKTFSKASSAPAERREWMNTLPKEGASLERVSGEAISMSDFLNTDHLQYMYDSAFRVLPSAIDGLKQVQRKIIYGLRKQSNPYDFRKVFQVAGVIANTANYHHGDQSLNAAIVKMAQDYPGSNNIPLLAGKGFFGSRLELGEDHGQPRYIDVCISKITDILFPRIDDDLLEHIVEDNTVVEPYNYVPIVPLLLINGALSIGTGYACNIYKHSALSIIDRIKDKLHKSKKLTALKPHINKWNGKIEPTEKTTFYYGKFTRKSTTTVIVTEIPILNRINDLISILNNSEQVDKWKNLTSDSINSVAFEVSFKQPMDNESISDLLNLVSYKPNASTRCGINANGQMVYYDSMEDIFDEWYKERYTLYVRRKEKLIAQLELAILILQNKIRFIKAVISKEIRINKLSNEELNALLEEQKYYKHNGSFDYILTMHMSSMTMTNLARLEKELEAKIAELEELKNTTIEVIWERELDTLVPLIKDFE